LQIKSVSLAEHIPRLVEPEWPRTDSSSNRSFEYAFALTREGHTEYL